MEPMLIAVTALSLVMAVAMAVLAWRLLRDEQRRADARVALLADLASRDAGDTAPAPRPAARRVEPPPAPVRRQAPAAARPPAPRPATPAAFDLPLHLDAPEPTPLETSGAPIGALFDAPRPAGHGLARAFAVVLVAAAMATGVWIARDLGGRRAAATVAAPVELVSLAHDRQDDTLRITGLVQNPRGGAERRDVVAVAFLFDAAGTLVASGRAPIDFTRLAPGDESPFVILVPHADGVARYRLGFRTRDGRVLAHVDRRSTPAAAASGGAVARPPADLTARAAR